MFCNSVSKEKCQIAESVCTPARKQETNTVARKKIDSKPKTIFW
jgi:hypothetical protein